MNSPVNPSGSALEASARNKSFPYTVAVLVAVHLVAIGGLLILGCGKTPPPVVETPAGDPPPTAPVLDTNLPVVVTTWETNTTSTPTPGGAISGTGGGQPGNGTVTTAERPVDTTPTITTTETPTGVGSEYKIVSGDNAYNIAKRSGVSVKALLAANAGVDWKKLKVGQSIQIPAAGTIAVPGFGDSSPAPGTTTVADTASVHTVKAGDNLIRISKKYGVSKKSIWTANGLTSDNIKVGQKLKIPASSGAAAPASGTPAVPGGGTLAPAPEPIATPLPTGRARP